MQRILIIIKDPEKIQELYMELTRKGFNCIFAEDTRNILDEIIKQSIDLILVALDSSSASAWTEPSSVQLQEIKIGGRQLPVIVLISKDMVHRIESAPDIDDFVVEPYDLSELVIRIKRIFKKTDKIIGTDVIQCGDLVIDTAKCEVYLEGRLLPLTFKEYELLRFLSKNKGRVFSRESLLNELWGYDYYGGDRTVDVHIRRLRSKIEDSNHTFIDTVRNMGYIFRDCNWSPSLENSDISNSNIATAAISNS